MFEKIRRRTMAPSRPILYPDQIGLAFFSLLAVLGGIYAIVKLVS